MIRRCLGRTPRGEDCGHAHTIAHSKMCAMCWGYLSGAVPGDPADDVEVTDGDEREACDEE